MGVFVSQDILGPFDLFGTLETILDLIRQEVFKASFRLKFDFCLIVHGRYSLSEKRNVVIAKQICSGKKKEKSLGRKKREL